MRCPARGGWPRRSDHGSPANTFMVMAGLPHIQYPRSGLQHPARARPSELLFRRTILHGTGNGLAVVFLRAQDEHSGIGEQRLHAARRAPPERTICEHGRTLHGRRPLTLSSPWQKNVRASDKTQSTVVQYVERSWYRIRESALIGEQSHRPVTAMSR